MQTRSKKEGGAPLRLLEAGLQLSSPGWAVLLAARKSAPRPAGKTLWTRWPTNLRVRAWLLSDRKNALALANNK